MPAYRESVAYRKLALITGIAVGRVRGWRRSDKQDRCLGGDRDRRQGADQPRAASADQDGQPVPSVAALQSVLAAHKPGDRVQARVSRGGAESAVQLTLGSRTG